MGWSALSVSGHQVANSDTDEVHSHAPSNGAESLGELDYISTVAPRKDAYRVMSRNPAANIADVGLRLLVVFLPFFLRERLAATGTSRHNCITAPFVLVVVVFVTIQVVGVLLSFAPCGTDKDTYNSGGRTANRKLSEPPPHGRKSSQMVKNLSPNLSHFTY
jgi:hypothetical protein